MKLLAGLFDHMVLQRNAANVCNALITGQSEHAGLLKARVRGGSKSSPVAMNLTLKRNPPGEFSTRLKGLPTGGPYTIELTIVDKSGKALDAVTIRDVLVGDVWIAAGQSNMQGCGRRSDAAKPHRMVRAFYMNDHWAVAADPIHNMWECVDQVHIDLCGGVHPGQDTLRGVGPAVAFGQEMFRLTAVPQGLLACAHGGTSMAQWDPALKDLGTKSLYGATLRRLAKNGGKAAGVIWYQGESDANPVEAPQYTQRMKDLIAAFRRDCRDPKLPFVLVQISRVAGWAAAEAWNSIQDQQRRLPELVRRCATVPSIDLDMEDSIHINGKDQNRLGRRLTQAMHTITASASRSRRSSKTYKPLPPPITLKGVQTERDPITGLANVIVNFENVVGSLQSGGRPCGFALTTPQGTSGIYRIDLDGSRVILHSIHPVLQLDDKFLSYGRGIEPPCNVIDAADRALPVFGPIRAAKPVARTPCIQTWLITPMLASAGKLEQLDYPTNLESLELTPRTFDVDFSSRHLELMTTSEDKLVYYLCRIQCPEPMKLTVGLGYDGPVKLWIDGKQLFHDPNGINPATMDKATIPWRASAGEHEILVAFGSNHGRAWGIRLRFQRTDVPQNLIDQGPDHYRLPVFLTHIKRLAPAPVPAIVTT